MAKKKIQLQDANGNVLHPLTLGECVTMSNGENLDTLMSKSQMFTPTIAQDKSMFKVGTGIDVDYSANVKDGAYESLVFKGKSLVNMSNRTQEFEMLGKTDNHTQISIAHKDLLKRNTKYILILNYNATFDTNSPYKNLYLDSGHGYSYIGNLTNRNIATDSSKGLFVSIITTKDEEKTDTSDIHLTLFKGSNNNRATISNLMLLEYQQGMENWDIPYFEGLCDVKMPILRNVGKNLANQSKYEIEAYVGGNDGVTVTIGSASKNTQSIIMEIEPNVSIVASSSSNSDRKVLACFNHFPKNGSKATKKTNNGYITTDTDTKYVMYYYNSNTVANGIVSQVQIEESPSPTQYEPYKTNILRTSEEIVLREVNGVQDTYNPLTGEYVRRIGEVVFDGSESWGAGSLVGDTMRFALTTQEYKMKTSSDGLCDKIPYIKWNSEDVEHVRVDGSTPYGNFIVWIKTSRLSTSDTQGFKQWLSQNSLTVQYILAEPVTTIVKPSTMTPFAYQNGHVILESGFEGQSLLPEIEYSVVTGRTGQVTQNTKVLRKQEQQIISLEELLLTQIVQMEYERTLLQFDYELQMMMLG